MQLELFFHLSLFWPPELDNWKDWCWSWNSNILATSCEELTRWKRPWCWEGLGAGGEGDDGGWDGWVASLTWWTWVWVNSGSWWWTGRPGVLWFMGSQRVGRDWATELNWYRIHSRLSIFTVGILVHTAWIPAIELPNSILNREALILVYQHFILCVFDTVICFNLMKCIEKKGIW